ncbi:hypothetical protein D3C87_1350130 [compost metagenome]
MVLEHHTGRLGRLAGGVADVEAFDAQRVQRGFVRIQVQRFGQRQGAARAGAGFGQGPGQRHFGVFQRLLQPRAAGALRTRQHPGRPPARLLDQQADQIRVGQGVGTDQHGRHGIVGVVLGDERFQHLGRGFAFGMRREERLVAQVAAAPHHRQVHTDLAAGHGHRNDVGVFAAGVLHGLLVQDARQRPHLVAQRGGFLKAQFTRRLLHARFDFAHDVFGFAIQEAHRPLHVALVLLGLDGAHARR